MAETTVPQPESQCVENATENILLQLSAAELLAPKYADKSLHLDWWWEQPFFEGEEYALPPLCIYIEALVLSTEDVPGNRAQRLTVQWNVYMEWRSNADSHVGALTKNNFLAFTPYRVAIHRALHGWKGENMVSGLKRIEGPVNMTGLERKGVLIRQSYKGIVLDETASTEKTFGEVLHLDLRSEIVTT